MLHSNCIQARSLVVWRGGGGGGVVLSLSADSDNIWVSFRENEKWL